MKGHFIVVEGLEGAGKSSIISLIAGFLKAKQHPVISTREPGGTPMSEAIRECVKQHWQETVTQETELLLMYAARSQLVHNVILPSLEKGLWVIGDRHNLSSVAYQGGGRQIEIKTLDTLREMTLGAFRPDFTIYLDVEPSVGLARARGRGQLDRIEQAGMDFFERARNVFIENVKNDSNAVQINANNSIETVQSDTMAALSNWYRQVEK